VSCPSSSFCAAVDEDGNALTYNGSAWSSPVAVDAGHNLTMLSCPSASFCMASDGTDAVIYNGGSWSAPASIEGANGTVQALSCASSSLCAAVDFTGNSVSNALIYNGSAWSAPDPIDPNTSMYWGFTSVSCPSASFCMAADASGYTWVYNGSSWTQAASVGQSGILQQVSCASSTSCLAEQWFGATYSWNGTSWSELPAPDNPTTLPLDLSCPTAAFCGAVDGLDEALTYTTGAPNPPTTTTAPSIAGAAQQGQTLTETHASWSPAPTGYTISWERWRELRGKLRLHPRRRRAELHADRRRRRAHHSRQRDRVRRGRQQPAGDILSDRRRFRPAEPAARPGSDRTQEHVRADRHRADAGR
jgi:hypothetical protein